MSEPAKSDFQLAQIRELAARKFVQFGKSEMPIRECYLFKNDFFAGVLLESGPFKVRWNLVENWATVERGNIVLEQINFGEKDRTRRAA
jgi:hypothetical protein